MSKVISHTTARSFAQVVAVASPVSEESFSASWRGFPSFSAGMLQSLKRGLDIGGAGLALIFLLPLLLTLWILVRLDGGPAFYYQMRVGRYGTLFKCYKFRTMVVDAEKRLQDLLKNDPASRAEFEQFWKLRQDPRITRIGAFLRRSSLDELPQLVNILLGEMSLVGPRPRSTAEIHRIVTTWHGQDPYFSVRPGLTGLWQVSGRNSLDLDHKIFLDTKYIRTWSLKGDVKIIFKTFHVVFRGDGAY